MKKKLSLLKELFTLISLFLALVLIFVPLPSLCMEILLAIDYVFAVNIFAVKIFNRNMMSLFFRELAVCFSVFTGGVAIAATRSFLTIENIEEQITIIRIIGDFICRENAVCGFFTTLLMCGAILFFCKLCITDITEIKARITLDGMNHHFWTIEQKLNKNEISEDEASRQRRFIQTQIDYYSGIDGAAKYLMNTIKAFVGMFIIVFAGGFAVGYIAFKMSWQEALNQYVMLSSGYLVVFVIPLFLVCLCFRSEKFEGFELGE